MSDTPLASGWRWCPAAAGGWAARSAGRCSRQGAKVVVDDRNRVTDADGRGPADHVAAEIVAVAVERWGRLDVCEVERGPGRDGGDEPRLSWAGLLVGSTGGIGLSAYAASKGGLLAFGRSLAAEGAAEDPDLVARC